MKTSSPRKKYYVITKFNQKIAEYIAERKFSDLTTWGSDVELFSAVSKERKTINPAKFFPSENSQLQLYRTRV